MKAGLLDTTRKKCPDKRAGGVELASPTLFSAEKRIVRRKE